MSEWKSIDTAPKGEKVLLYGVNDFSREAWMHAGIYVDRLNEQADACWTCWDVQSWAYEEYAPVNPTHWMPLPAPPVP